VEETTAASVTLNDEAQTLKRLVTRFRVSGQGNAAATLRSTAQQMRAPAAPAPRAAAPAPRRAVAQSRGSAAVAQDNWEEF
ncbi:MAG: methyl-accepting chemotaxis protein, partial [Rhizobium sp.]